MKRRRWAAAALSAFWGMVVGAAAHGGEPPAPDPTPPAAVAPSPAPAPSMPRAARRRAVDDKRRTIKSYGSNLAYNALGVWTPGNRPPLLITAAFTAPAFAWDADGIAYFDRHPHANMGEIGRVMGGGLAVGGLTVGLFSAGRIARGQRFRSATYDVSQAILVNGVYTFALKFAVGRERPDHSDNRSFPSGHASNAFAGATTIVKHYPRLAIPVYGLAGFIAVSRLAANKHHLSDVVAGAGFGFGVGRLVVRRNGRPPDASKAPAEPKPSLTWAPYAGPSRDGGGLVVSVTF